MQFSSRKTPRPVEVQDLDDEESIYSQPTPVEEVLARIGHNNMSHEEVRPIPPPHDHDYHDHHDSVDFQDPGTRLFERTTSTEDDHMRGGLVLESLPHEEHAPIATLHSSTLQAHDDDYEYEMADARPARIERSRPIQVPPSTENSYSTRGGNNRVTFMGDLNHDHDNHTDYHDNYDTFSAGRTMTSGFPGTVRSDDSSRTGSSGVSGLTQTDISRKAQLRSTFSHRIVVGSAMMMIEG